MTTETNVAKNIDFTTVSKQQWLNHFTVDISKNNVAETNGFSMLVFVNVVKT